MKPSLKPKQRWILPHYHGRNWAKVHLPKKVQEWSAGGSKSIAKDGDDLDKMVRTIDGLNKSRAWVWPKRRHFFFSDLHGDSEAFVESLVASGGVKRTGKKTTDFHLTRVGREAVFVIGGDCFDKGPSSLNLLRTIKHLIDCGARTRLLAGNHDIRLLYGMVAVGAKTDLLNEHFFIRTGQKIVPLLVEIWDGYLKDGDGLKGVPSKKVCRRRLFPSEQWFEDFPKSAAGSLRASQIKREVIRMRKKTEKFEDICATHGLSIRQVYATVKMWRKLFLNPDGEFTWFFDQLRLVYQSGSLLFVHAGLDNDAAAMLRTQGVKALNRSFRKALVGRPFDYYYGPLCNMIRTKYRSVDLPFTKHGAHDARKAGITAIVHGHRNLHNGQRLAGRRSLLHFECDASLDIHTRKKEWVRGRGAAVLIVEPKGYLLGVSSDHPFVKVFEPRTTLNHMQRMREKKRAKA